MSNVGSWHGSTCINLQVLKGCLVSKCKLKSLQQLTGERQTRVNYGRDKEAYPLCRAWWKACIVRAGKKRSKFLRVMGTLIQNGNILFWTRKNSRVLLRDKYETAPYGHLHRWQHASLGKQSLLKQAHSSNRRERSELGDRLAVAKADGQRVLLYKWRSTLYGILVAC